MDASLTEVQPLADPRPDLSRSTRAQCSHWNDLGGERGRLESHLSLRTTHHYVTSMDLNWPSTGSGGIVYQLSNWAASWRHR